nr:anti-phage-associated DUF1156 domain-containing protein [Ferrimicrobium acidiphilum]
MDDRKVTPFSLQDAPALIEKLLPVQRISVESHAEQEAKQSKTLTATGSYWKGRKPLVLAKACVLGALLPATDNPSKDLETFELLMAMDDASMGRRATSVRPSDILSATRIEDVNLYFTFSPNIVVTPPSAPFDVLSFGVKPSWKRGISLEEKQYAIAQYLATLPFKERVSIVERAENVDPEALYAPIWKRVNEHLGTDATSFPELVEQLGIMRFGHRPRVADTFSGSGQIPFEAARLGCDVYASDLSPVACLLTWGAFNVVGASREDRKKLEQEQAELIAEVRAEINALGIETDGNGWRGKVYLYCLEVIDPATGWQVPLMPSRVVSKGKRAIAMLVPIPAEKRYDIEIVSGVSEAELKAAEVGTYRDESVVHSVDGVEYRTRLSTIRGDYTDGYGVRHNRLRQWEISDVTFRPDDIYQERLYAIQWIEDNPAKTRPESEFRSVTGADLEREHTVTDYVQNHLAEWQEVGWVPDMRIEPGDKTDEPIRTRGWTYWHHLFNPRQLLLFALLRKTGNELGALLLGQLQNVNCRNSRWNPYSGIGQTVGIFDNQALNTLFNYGTRGFDFCESLLKQEFKRFPLDTQASIDTKAAANLGISSDIFITDPPYGDAVKYEEIYEFFIAWLRKNPPSEFADWVWDSRRALAIKGEDHNFKAEMVAAYKAMTSCMPDNGLQVIMFTHQSGSIWADMSNIVWASGLRVSAAWYVVTETDSALRQGQYIKGTVLLIVRKRLDSKATSRDELAYEIEDEVKAQVEMLTGLNQDTKDIYRDENLFEDADLQMAGYAAALRVLTKYSTIDGIDMAQESLRPRVKKQSTLVDELIDFAVSKANEFLVPQGLSESVWDKLTGVERFYLKLVDMESKEIFVLSNYQNFAKAFKVRDFNPLMEENKANKARLKGAVAFNKRFMGSADEFGSTRVRALLYGVYLLTTSSTKGEDVIAQLKSLLPDYYRDRDTLISVSEYLSQKTAKLHPEESNSANILRDLIRNERV